MVIALGVACIGGLIISVLLFIKVRLQEGERRFLQGYVQQLSLDLKEREGRVEDMQQTLSQLTSRNGHLEERTCKMDTLEQQVNSLQQDRTKLLTEKASLSTALDQQRQENIEKLALLEQAKVQLLDTFKALSADVLSANSQSFLTLAQGTFEKLQEKAATDLTQRQKSIHEMISPIQQTLQGVDVKLKDLEKDRISSYEILRQQVTDLIGLQKELRSETSNLVRALHTPHVRGQWGEMQLKRVVELSGMIAHCDFVEQTSVDGDKGRLRPDMIINLPGNKSVIVDAKAPLSAYLDALKAPNEEGRKEFLVHHARHVRQHIRQLSQRAYWDQFPSTPEFVVLFLPGETFFSAALETDPSLIEIGVKERVILATPTTLIALLRSVSYGWRQESIAANTRIISDLGRELYKRLHDCGTHINRMGKNLSTAVDSYNQAVGTLEHRVLVSARKFQALDTSLGNEKLPDLVSIDTLPRIPSAPELLDVPLSKEVA